MTERPIPYYCNSCCCGLDIWYCLAFGLYVQVDGGIIPWDGGEQRGDFLSKQLTKLTRVTPMLGPTPHSCGSQGKKECKLSGVGMAAAWVCGAKVEIEIVWSHVVSRGL